jgi:hypothetical protein
MSSPRAPRSISRSMTDSFFSSPCSGVAATAAAGPVAPTVLAGQLMTAEEPVAGGLPMTAEAPAAAAAPRAAVEASMTALAPMAADRRTRTASRSAAGARRDQTPAMPRSRRHQCAAFGRTAHCRRALSDPLPNSVIGEREPDDNNQHRRTRHRPARVFRNLRCGPPLTEPNDTNRTRSVH